MNTTRPKIYRIAFFWPGLPQLWIRGSWAGLLVAVGFTALVNVLLLSTLVYGQWLSLQTRLTGLCVLVVVWSLARWQSRHLRHASLAAPGADQQEETESEPVPPERDQLFREAQGHYLRNDWVRAEQVLLALLKQDSRDVESRLMLATLWRHQGRLAEATRQLDRLQRLEAAEKWQHEIAAERQAIEQPDIDKETEDVSDVLPERTEAQENEVETEDDNVIDNNGLDDDLRRAA